MEKKKRGLCLLTMASLSVDTHTATPALKQIYTRFSTFGRGHRIDPSTVKMESKAFIKFCRDTSLINKKLSQTSLDLIFTRVKARGQRTIDFHGFLSCIELAAKQRGVTYDRFTTHILKWHGLANDGSPTHQQREGPIVSPTRTTTTTTTTTTTLAPAPVSMSPSPSSTTTPEVAAAPSTILLVVDMQIDFFSRNAAVSKAFPELPQRISSLIEECRFSGAVEIVHLREGSNPQDSKWYEFWSKLNPGCDSSADSNLVEECALDINNERVFVKYGYDGVGVDSGLVRYLDSRSRQNGRPLNILVCGLVTSCCIHMNAAGLFLRGYPTFVVADACGDRTQKMHLESLQRESRRCYAVVEKKDVSNALESNEKNGVEERLIESCWPNRTQKEKEKGGD